MKNVHVLSLVALMVISSTAANNCLLSAKNIAKGGAIAAGRILTHKGITLLADKAFTLTENSYVNWSAKIATYVALETGSFLGFSKIRNLIAGDSEAAMYTDFGLSMIGYASNWLTQENRAIKLCAFLAGLWVTKKALPEVILPTEEVLSRSSRIKEEEEQQAPVVAPVKIDAAVVAPVTIDPAVAPVKIDAAVAPTSCHCHSCLKPHVNPVPNVKPISDAIPDEEVLS